jgi:predicted house-cleaning NTP pyrophosphatase (Maf/HAM1 superfamily)
MHRSLSLALLLSACGPIPVQMSSQKQTQSSKQEVAQEVAQDVAQQSAHESKQGTTSMPVIIICNTNNSANARCATVPENGPMLKEVQKRYGGEGK